MSSLLSFVTSNDCPDNIDVDRFSLASSSSSDSQNQDDLESDLYMSVQASPVRSTDDIFASASNVSLETRDSSDLNSEGSFSLNRRPLWNELQDNIRRQMDRFKECEGETARDEMNYADLVIGMAEEYRWRNSILSDPQLSRLVKSIDPTFGENSEKSDAPTVYPPPETTNVLVCSTFDGIDEVSICRDTVVHPSDIAKLALRSIRESDPPKDRRLATWIDHAIEHVDEMVEVLVRPSNDCRRPSRRGELTEPVRDMWIFQLHPNRTVRAMLECQEFRCAGCLSNVAGEYARRVQYCEYYGAVFCLCCHSGAKAIVPARVIHLWNFRELLVCDRAAHFLQETREKAVIHMRKAAPLLISKIRPLRVVIELRSKLKHMWQYVRMCADAERVQTRIGGLRALFFDLPAYFLEESDVFSMADLEKVRSGEMVGLLEPIVAYARQHIENCTKCLDRSFLCWLCGNANDYLFPFQTEKISRCDHCGSLSHSKCAAKAEKENGYPPECTKCKRMESSRNRRRFVSVCDE